MLSMIFRFLGLVFIAWLFRWLFSYFSGTARDNRANQDPTGPSSHMVKDPVCGMYMDSRLAVRLENKREDFYFCSEECRNKYLGKSNEAGASP